MKNNYAQLICHAQREPVRVSLPCAFTIAGYRPQSADALAREIVT